MYSVVKLQWQLHKEALVALANRVSMSDTDNEFYEPWLDFSGLFCESEPFSNHREEYSVGHEM